MTNNLISLGHDLQLNDYRINFAAKCYKKRLYLELFGLHKINVWCQNKTKKNKLCYLCVSLSSIFAYF